MVHLLVSPLYRGLVERRRAEIIPEVIASQPLSIVTSQMGILKGELNEGSDSEGQDDREEESSC